MAEKPYWSFSKVVLLVVVIIVIVIATAAGLLAYMNWQTQESNALTASEASVCNAKGDAWLGTCVTVQGGNAGSTITWTSVTTYTSGGAVTTTIGG